MAPFRSPGGVLNSGQALRSLTAAEGDTPDRADTDVNGGSRWDGCSRRGHLLDDHARFVVGARLKVHAPEPEPQRFQRPAGDRLTSPVRAESDEVRHRRMVSAFPHRVPGHEHAAEDEGRRYHDEAASNHGARVRQAIGVVKGLASRCPDGRGSPSYSPTSRLTSWRGCNSWTGSGGCSPEASTVSDSIRRRFAASSEPGLLVSAAPGVGLEPTTLRINSPNLADLPTCAFGSKRLLSCEFESEPVRAIPNVSEALADSLRTVGRAQPVDLGERPPQCVRELQPRYLIDLKVGQYLSEPRGVTRTDNRLTTAGGTNHEQHPLTSYRRERRR